jgi:hypothetical protein
MRKAHFYSLLICLLLVFTSASWSQGGPGNGMPRYDPKTETTLTGTIDEIQLHSGHHRGTGTHLLLKTDSGTIEVHVGPTFYLEKQQFPLAKGDRIEVVGSKVKIGNDDVLLAREISKDGKKLVLRDRSGIPLWSGGKRMQ